MAAEPRVVAISYCGGPLDGMAGFALDTRPLVLSDGTYRLDAFHPEGDAEFEWEPTEYPITADSLAAAHPSQETYTREQLTPERIKQIEFDAWLGFRPEFAEVLTAFRDAFGTDTSAAAGDDPTSEYSRAVAQSAIHKGKGGKDV